MIKQHRRKLATNRAPQCVVLVGVAPAEPVSDEDLRVANAAYFGRIAKLVGPRMAARALDEYVQWVKESAEEMERRGGVVVGDLAIPD